LSIAGKPVIPALAASYDRNGWLGGVHAGYDWQFSPRWLVGIEADFDWADLSGGGSSATSFLSGQSTGTFNASQKIDWFGTLRARLGVLPTPDLLLYATGGLAYGKVNDSANSVMDLGQSNSIGNFGYGFGCGGIYGSSTCFAGSSSRTSAGWAAGAGGEYRVTSNLALRVEYLYVDLGSSNFTLPAVTYFGLKPSQLNGSSDAAFNLVRFGASYRF
jgi:outer membrane immunogenic protein